MTERNETAQPAPLGQVERGVGRPVPERAEGDAPHVDDAYYMGATGGEATEGERLAFESWMRGHCWALCATWDGKAYRSGAEQGGDIDPRAMRTRQLWAAWRDRAALARLKTPNDRVEGRDAALSRRVPSHDGLGGADLRRKT